jgi:hypothetical protein
MRRIHFVGIIIVSGLMWIVAGVAQAADCGCSSMSNRHYQSLCGEPCFSPPGCSTAQGCCDCPPSACDNAWDGYCEEKAKWQAFFAKVGAPKPKCYYGNRGCGYCATPMRPVEEAPAEATPTPATTPRPAMATPRAVKPELPAPYPAPEKTSRAKVLYPWMR